MQRGIEPFGAHRRSLHRSIADDDVMDEYVCVAEQLLQPMSAIDTVGPDEFRAAPNDRRPGLHRVRCRKADPGTLLDRYVVTAQCDPFGGHHGCSRYVQRPAGDHAASPGVCGTVRRRTISSSPQGCRRGLNDSASSTSDAGTAARYWATAAVNRLPTMPRRKDIWPDSEPRSPIGKLPGSPGSVSITL